MELSKNSKGVVAVGITLLVIGGISYAVYRFTKNKIDVGNGVGNGVTHQSNADNFNSLKNNMGLNPNKDNIIIASFNGEKNTAQFYSNSRVVIFDSNKKIIMKGSYSDGGKTISIDNGKEVSSGSVYGNLLSLIK